MASEMSNSNVIISHMLSKHMTSIVTDNQ